MSGHTFIVSDASCMCEIVGGSKLPPKIATFFLDEFGSSVAFILYDSFKQDFIRESDAEINALTSVRYNH